MVLTGKSLGNGPAPAWLVGDKWTHDDVVRRMLKEPR